jgi:hypothetical protein
VRRLFGWTAGLVGIAALARVLARRQARREAAAPRPPLPSSTQADPAEALRHKLSETRATDDTATAGQEPISSAEPTETLDERRARVHAKAQEAIEAMQEPPE